VFEFGKDFIARREEDGIIYQYAFQTKAGDLGLAEWNKDRGQIDLLRTNALAHPAFDRTLPRRAVFVTTGRLTGAAPLAAQEYAEHLKMLGELEFTLWDRETLIGMMSDSPEVGLAGTAEGPLLAVLGKIDAGELQEKELEQLSRRWIAGDGALDSLWRWAVEAAVVSNRLRRQERLDLACYAALCLVRAAWPATHGAEPPNPVSVAVADLGRSLFRHYASTLFERCGEEDLDPLAFIHAHEVTTAFVTYPVRCLRLVEILGLLGLLALETDDPAAGRVAEYLSKFFEKHPGAVHPISDRWAVSIIPPIILLDKTGDRDRVAAVLKGVTRWIGDRYENDILGLAGPHASAQEEVDYLLGTPFEHIGVRRRSESYLSTVVLDLLAMLEAGELYAAARNDFLAVNAMACVVESPDTPGQYVLGATDSRYEPNLQYKEEWSPDDGWKVAPHHYRSQPSYYLGRINRHWDHLAVSSVLRDRHFLPTCRALIA
jgi:hypothetical protein